MGPLGTVPLTRIAWTLETELGARVFSYLDTENSDWCFKMWWMTGRWWWDAESRTFVEETRPQMLRFVELNERDEGIVR